MKTIYILLSVIVVSIFLVSCENYNNLNNCATIEVISGCPEISETRGKIIARLEKEECISVEYNVNSLEKNTFYYIQVEIDVPDGGTAYLLGDDEDINRVSVKGSYDVEGIASRIVKTNSLGNCTFSILVQGNSHEEEYLIKRTTLSSCSNNELFSSYESESGHVKMVLYKKDVNESGLSDNDIIKWLDALDKIRCVVSQISDNHIENTYICATEEFNHYGLAGNPIYICRSKIKPELERVANTINLPTDQQEICWGIVHEICHTGDGFGYGDISPRVFDSEFSAQLECAYCMEVAGYRYNGELTALEYFGNSIPLENRIYSDEGFLLCILNILDANKLSISCLNKTFDNSSYLTANNEADKLSIFLSNLSYDTGVNIIECMTETQLEIIRSKFE